MKRKCPKCGIEKPLTTEFFHRGKDIKEGFKSACKVCRSADKKKWRDANKERINAQAAEYRRINKDKINKHNKAYSKAYREKYPDKVKLTNAKSKRKNQDKIKAYRERTKERQLERQRLWRKNNPEKFGQANRRGAHMRRMSIKQAVTPLSLSDWENCLGTFNESCSYCGKKTEDITQDHFTPVSKGGEYSKGNVVPACRSCNSSKSNNDFFDWYPKQKFYSAVREKKIIKYLGIKENTQQIAMF